MCPIRSLARKCSRNYAEEIIIGKTMDKSNRGVTILTLHDGLGGANDQESYRTFHSKGIEFAYFKTLNVHTSAHAALRDRASWMLLMAPGYTDETTVIDLSTLFNGSCESYEFTGCESQYLSLVGWALIFGARIDEQMAMIELGSRRQQ